MPYCCNDETEELLMAAIVYQTNKKTGITYAYESISYWDKEKKQPRARLKCIGRLDPETKQIVPTRKGKAAISQKTRKSLTSIATRSFYGTTYIGEDMGVIDNPKSCFPDSYCQILSLAY